MIGLILIAIVVRASPASATLVVLVNSADGVVLAVDARLARIQGADAMNGMASREVCKIHDDEGREYAFAPIGVAETSHGFNAARTIRRAFDPRLSTEKAMSTVDTALKDEFLRFLKAYVVDGPAAMDHVRGRTLTTGYVLVGIQSSNRAPFIWITKIRSALNADGVPEVHVDGRSQPVDIPFWMPLGMTDALYDWRKTPARLPGPQNLSTPGNLNATLDAIRELIRIQAEATPDVVGLPMDAVVVTKDGLRWLTPMEECTKRRPR